jgi:hypothetical protein
VKTTLLLAILCVLTADYSAAEELKPLAYLSGNSSKVTMPSYERITSADGWARVWAKHLGTSKDDDYRPLFEVDFDRCMVIAIFRGDRTNIRRIEIQPLITKGDSIILREDDISYQTSGADNNKAPDKPYAFVVIPKTSREIILEENVAKYLGDPPTWKEFTRLTNKQAKK